VARPESRSRSIRARSTPRSDGQSSRGWSATPRGRSCSITPTKPVRQGRGSCPRWPPRCRIAPPMGAPTRSRSAGFRFSPPSNEPLTAQTFKYSIERALNPRIHGPGPSAGPYYVTFRSRKMIVLRPNPNYRGPRPHRLREIRIAIGVGRHRALRAIEAGAADYASPSVSDSDASRLAHRYGPASESAQAGRQRYFVNHWPASTISR
jgi:hypothetical protein